VLIFLKHPPLGQKDLREYACFACQGLEVEPVVDFSFCQSSSVDIIDKFECV